MSTLRDRLENATIKRKLAEEKLRTVAIKSKTEILQKYDFIDPRLRGKRRKVNIERGKGQQSLHTRSEYLQGYSSARDSVRNNDLAKSILNQFAFNVVGKLGGRAHFQTGNDPWDSAANYFVWKTWGRDCDGTGQAHWNVKLKQMLGSALTDGGIINVFDDFTIEADGRLYSYTLDWVAPADKPENLPEWQKTFSHKDGWIYNSRGRIIGVCIGKERAMGPQRADDLAVYYFGDSVWLWSPFICAPLLDQQVGVSAFASSWLNIEGLKEMRSKELDTAGIAASILMQILTDEGAEAAAWAAAGGDPDEVANLEDIEQGEPADTPVAKRDNWEEFEAMRGARIHYADAGDKADVLDFKRPNLDTETYYKDVSRGAGASLGFGDAYTQMKADRSYTAFRGEMLMTWRGVFENMQKELERDICDRVTMKAIEWGMSQGAIPKGPEGWQGKVSYHWPIMPEVDPAKWMAAIGKEFGFGLATPAKYLGPDGNRIAKQNRLVNDEIMSRSNGDNNDE